MIGDGTESKIGWISFFPNSMVEESNFSNLEHLLLMNYKNEAC